MSSTSHEVNAVAPSAKAGDNTSTLATPLEWLVDAEAGETGAVFVPLGEPFELADVTLESAAV